MQNARSFRLYPWHIVVAVSLLVAVVLSTVILISDLSAKLGAAAGEKNMLLDTQRQHKKNALQLMASRLGELQAQVLELEILGERLSALAGIKTPEKTSTRNKTNNGQGGPLVVDHLSELSLGKMIEQFELQLGEHGSALQNLEPILLERRAEERLLPTAWPINKAKLTSRFGYRRDPLLGVYSFHKGIDFGASSGTPVLAAAGGIVQRSKYHRAYGNVIDIDHGANIVTRYAHLSIPLVTVGQLVKRGERIALSGSSGRSTGPHLHFEVLINNVPQNPIIFLNRSKLFAKKGGSRKE